MLTEKNKEIILNYHEKVKYTPIVNEEDNIDHFSKSYINSIFLLPNQYAYIINIANGTISAFKHFDQCLGYTNTSFTIEELYGLIHPEDQDEMINIITQAWDFGIKLNFEKPFDTQFIINYRVKQNNGEYSDILRQSSVLQIDKTGRLISTISICSKIMNLNTKKRIQFKMHGDHAENFIVEQLSFAKKQQLTKREIEIINLIAQGFSTKQIASQLGISVLTVETQRKNMLKKYNMHNTFQLVFWAKDQELI